MNYILIRAYEKDDYITRLCYESWMRSGYQGKIIFYSEPYSTKWLKDLPNTEWMWREPCGNFGGQIGARNIIKGLASLRLNDNDWVVSCDTDVVIKENPFNYLQHETNFAGFGGNVDGFYHISGQLMMFRGDFIKEIFGDTQEDIDRLVNEMIYKGLNVADDILISYRLRKKASVQLFEDKWIHQKFYELEPREDWETIIKEL